MVSRRLHTSVELWISPIILKDSRHSSEPPSLALSREILVVESGDATAAATREKSLQPSSRFLGLPP